jgi:hypothetical protein
VRDVFPAESRVYVPATSWPLPQARLTVDLGGPGEPVGFGMDDFVRHKSDSRRPEEGRYIDASASATRQSCPSVSRENCRSRHED